MNRLAGRLCVGSEYFWFCGLHVCGPSVEACLDSNHSVWGDDSFMIMFEPPQPQLSVHACQLVGQKGRQPAVMCMYLALLHLLHASSSPFGVWLWVTLMQTYQHASVRPQDLWCVFQQGKCALQLIHV